MRRSLTRPIRDPSPKRKSASSLALTPYGSHSNPGENARPIGKFGFG